MSTAARSREITDYDRVVQLCRLRAVTIEDMAAALFLRFADVAAMIDDALNRGEIVERPKARNPTGRPCEVLLEAPDTAPQLDIRDKLTPAQITILRELMRRRRRATEGELRVALYGLGDDRGEHVIHVMISQMRQRLAPFGITIPTPPYAAGWALLEGDKARVRQLFGESW